MTQRYKLTIEYDGRPFVGWQQQPGLPSVQSWLEHALQRFCGTPVECVASGRTDAGVHALGQVVHVDLPQTYPAYNLVQGTNFHLRDIADENKHTLCPISVLQVEPVAEDFHARFSAQQRGYIYKISNRPSHLTWQSGLAWHIPQSLDAVAMHEAAQHLIGTHDFTSFRSQGCQAASARKTIDSFTITRQGDEILCHVAARSFLYHQVRNMVGTLARVGRGKLTAADIPTILTQQNRAAAGPMAPPDGLYFAFVRY